MAYRREDAQELLYLLQQFRPKIPGSDKKDVGGAFDRLTTIINSDLFQALLDVEDYYAIALETEERSKEAAAMSESALLPKVPVETKKKRKKSKDRSQVERFNRDDDRDDQGEEYIPPVVVPKFPAPPEEVIVQESDLYNVNAAQNNGEIIYEEIVLTRGETGFGFTIAGGYDAPQNANDPGIYVTNIIPGGAAHQNGLLRINDLIISVNGVNLENVSHEKAFNTLKQSSRTMTLVVCREALPIAAEASDMGSYEMSPPPPSQDSKRSRDKKKRRDREPEEVVVDQGRDSRDSRRDRREAQEMTPQPPPSVDSGPRRRERPQASLPPVHTYEPPQASPGSPTTYQIEAEVELIKPKGYSQGYGFSISGGPGNEVIDADGTKLQGIIITRVIEGGLAEQNGGIHMGDRLIEVNGQSIWTATHAEAVQLLKSSPNAIKLRLLKKDVTNQYDRNSSEQASSRQESDKGKGMKGLGSLFKGRKK